MKTIEQKAREHAGIPTDAEDISWMQFSSRTHVISYNKYKSFLSGYQEANRWRDPKVELPEEGVEVFVKVRRRGGYLTVNPLVHGNSVVGIVYTTSMVVNDSSHSKSKYPFMCEGYFETRAGNCSMEVIGWKPIE